MKKKFAMAGMCVGIVLAIIGFLMLCGAFGDAAAYGSTSMYDSGFASFGGDYYTYSVNNAGEAASAARAAASNVRELADMVQTSGGLFLICFGLLALCGFGVVFAGCDSLLIPTTVAQPQTMAAEETQEVAQEIDLQQPAEETETAPTEE